MSNLLPNLIALVFALVPMGLAVLAFMTLIRIRNAAEETNRRLEAIEAKLGKN